MCNEEKGGAVIKKCCMWMLIRRMNGIAAERGW